MSMSCTVILAVLLVVAAASPAHAQAGRSERPYRGLFGSSRAELSSSIFTYGGFDVTTNRRAVNSQIIRRKNDGGYGGLNGSLSYSRPVWKTFSIEATGAADLRLYHPGTSASTRAQTSYVQLTVGKAIHRRANLRVTQSVAISSYYGFNLYSFNQPGSVIDRTGLSELTSPTTDSRLVRGRSYDYLVSPTLTVPIGRFDTLYFDGLFRNLWGTERALRLTSQGGGARWSRRVARAVSMQVGYGYQQGTTAGVPSAGGLHRLDTGALYSAPLSFSRRTRVSAFAGAGLASTRVRIEPVLIAHVPQVIGYAQISHELGRTWTIGATYSRQFQFSELYANPTLTNSTDLSVRGLLTRRLSLILAGGYSTSGQDAGRGDRAYENLFALTRTQVAITRTLAISVEYAYYAFDAQDTLTLSGLNQELDAQLDRHSVRVGLSLWVPLLKQRAK